MVDMLRALVVVVVVVGIEKNDGLVAWPARFLQKLKTNLPLMVCVCVCDGSAELCFGGLVVRNWGWVFLGNLE